MVFVCVFQFRSREYATRLRATDAHVCACVLVDAIRSDCHNKKLIKIYERHFFASFFPLLVFASIRFHIPHDFIVHFVLSPMTGTYRNNNTVQRFHFHMTCVYEWLIQAVLLQVSTLNIVNCYSARHTHS